MLGIGKRGQIAGLITQDLLRKDKTKKRGQNIDVLREQLGIAGAQTREETQQTGAMSREELAQKSATHRRNLANTGDLARQKLADQGAYKRAVDVADIRGQWGVKQQKESTTGAVKVADTRGEWQSRISQEEQDREIAAKKEILATIPTMSDEGYEYNPGGVEYNESSVPEDEKKKKDKLYDETLLLP